MPRVRVLQLLHVYLLSPEGLYTEKLPTNFRLSCVHYYGFEALFYIAHELWSYTSTPSHVSMA